MFKMSTMAETHTFRRLQKSLKPSLCSRVVCIQSLSS